MSAKPIPYEGQDNLDGQQENPIIAKVRATLLKTGPSQWVESGEPLAAEKKYAKMVDSWEHIYVLELKKGNLVLRCSTPVLGQFQDGSYSLSPKSSPNYTIELRDKSWDYHELTDIARRPTAGTQVTVKKFETLAHGEVARELFDSVSTQVQAYLDQKNAEYDLQVAEILKTLEKMIQVGFASAWQKKSEHGNTVTWYRSKVGEVQVAIGRQARKDSPIYKLILSNQEGLSRTYDNSFARSVFLAAEDFEKNAGLIRLDQLLNELD